MMRDLIVGFIDEPWVREFDLSTLERVNAVYVSGDWRKREGDVVWRLKWGGDWLYVYLLLEFQSSIDRFMALRMMVYLGLLYQDLIAQKALTQQGMLPPVLPIVLYNGEARWSAPRDVTELIQSIPDGFERYLPKLHYLLLDEGDIALDRAWSEESRNLAAALFRLEQHPEIDELLSLLSLLVDWLQGQEQAQLRRHFVGWIKRVLLPQWVPADELQDWTTLDELSEVQGMLAERAKKWPQRWLEEGLEKGLEKGLTEGREQGLAKGLEQGLTKGREQGRESALIATALSMISRTEMDDATIADLVGLPAEQVRALREQRRG